MKRTTSQLAFRAGSANPAAPVWQILALVSCHPALMDQAVTSPQICSSFDFKPQ